MTGQTLIGQRVPKLDAVDKVTGRLGYVADVHLPGMLHGKLLRSPYPHARIRRIDTSAAERLPGVMAVITGRDMPQKRFGHLVKDITFLPLDRVRYIGEPVAAVAAVDEETAERALDLIDVEYEELPAVFEAEEAMRPGAPLVHEDLARYEVRNITAASPLPVARLVPGTNLCHHFKLRRGDVEQGFREADRIFQDTFRVQMVHHAPLEPHGAVAQVAPSGHITVWSCTQTTSRLQLWLAEYFDLPASKVHVIGTKPGGGFGAKIALRLEPYCVALSRKAGRPVRIVLTRSEEFIYCAGRRPATIRIKTGVMKDGRLVARQAELFWNGGAHSYTGPISIALAGLVVPGPYRIPHVRVDSYLVYTNRAGACAFRGLGAPQMNWAVERHMDIIARGLGIDPLELRLKNCLETGDTAPWGEVLGDVRLRDCLLRAAEAMGWGKGKVSPHRGRGIAALWKWTVPGSVSQAQVKVFEDGSALVITGTTDVGTGLETVLAQVAGEALGLPVDRIRVRSADTELGQYDHGAASSRSATHAGNAVLRAALDAREQILQIASRQMEVPPEELELRDQQVLRRAKPQESLPLAHVLRGKGVLVGKGEFQGAGEGVMDPETGQAMKPVAAEWKFGAAGAEVDVDPATGVTSARRVVTVHDIGRVLNAMNVATQVEGSVVMGVGSALYEEMVFDGGRVVNPSFMEYLMPTALEAPREIVSIFLEPGTGAGPFGAKGIGEPPFIGIAAAVGNAVADAVGAQIRDLPITPEKVLAALEAQGGVPPTQENDAGGRV